MAQKFGISPLVGVAAVLLLLLLSVGCSSAGGGKEASQAEHAAEIVEVTFSVVEHTRLEFAPQRIEVVAGRKVKLTLDNVGQLEHDLKVADIPAEIEQAGGGHGGETGGQHGEADVAVHTLPGTKGSVVFTPTHPGDYEVLCTLPGHKDSGMVGQLVVLA